ncbi:MAG: TonB-dependent receptor [Bacteroidales bacterium]|nr:TonB-dependent receptor [Bacteroidales bacterium]MCM1147733.1 TonB-dependent receptor [Bacteroidales bacterium]MCM1206657.1 TonB-dependent receptor [Bacillota bacterium]MCM1510602.1 TonB-dependent receptor [Clostridium sp.]
MRKKAYIALAIASYLMPCHAQNDDIWRNMDLDQIVVTGTRTPKTLKDTPIQTRVISAADIAKSDATNIEDLLQQELPGVEFSYAMNQQVNMNLSGFAGQGVLFLIDGERVAGETMDNIDFTRLSMADIERIEIVKGAASALYGSNAAGGVINIITRRNREPWSLHLDARLAEHNSQRYNMIFGLSKGIFSNTLTTSRTSADNYSVHNKDNNPATRTFQQVYGDNTWNFKDNFALDFCRNFHILGRAGYFFRSVERTVETPERYRGYTAGLKALWKISDKDDLELSYSFDQYDKSQFQRAKSLDIRSYSNVQNITRLLYNHRFGEDGMLTVGGDYMYDYLMNSNLDSDHHQESLDIFAQYDWRINRQWEIVGAMRYDYFSDGRMSRATPKLSIRYTPLHNLTFRASYGMGFRAPTLKEKYYDFDMANIWIVLGNKDLKAETSHNFNISADYVRGPYNFTLAGYYNKVRDRITTGVPYYMPGDDRQLYLDYVNIGKMDVYNIEATIQARWHTGIGAKLSYVFSHEDAEANVNQYMPARPHSLTARVDWDKQLCKDFGLNIALSGRAMSSVDNTEYIDMYDITKGAAEVHYPAYSLWKLQMTARIMPFAQVSFTLDNLFNYRPDYYYYNAPLTTGFNAMVGLSLEIDKIF